LTVPGIGWVLAYTIAAEIGDIGRFQSPNNLAGYTGLCPRVVQSGDKNRRGPLTKHGPRYLRWALLEATIHALRHPVYAERYQRTKKRPWQAAWRQGRPDRGRPPTDARDLAHAHRQRTVQRCCSGRRRFSSGGLTALLE
jgi:transposase